MRTGEVTHEQQQQLVKFMGETYPLRKYGQPSDVAASVAFLADNESAAWITGHLMTLDGGLTLTNASAAAQEALVKQVAANKK